MSKRTYTGKIVSKKMQKTVVVAVDMPKKHKIYGKTIKMTKRFLVHSTIEANIGDTVHIEESKPFSKDCSWIITGVVDNKLEEKKA
jgi:small subunit ribosomal protein S17